MKGYLERFRLDGRVAVVTGGAGILGRHFCAGLADVGAKVAVVDLDGRAAAEVARELASVRGARAIGIGCDVASEASVAEMLERVEAELGPVQVLHNNAATKTSDLKRFFASTEAYRLEDWREVMAVNLDGLFLVARAVGARMARHGVKGSIIQTGSIYGVVAPDPRIYEGSQYLGTPINTPAVYSASKAAVLGLTRHLAAQWAPAGIRVNALVPGGVQSGQNSVFTEKYSARVPMGRMAQAEEMVGALLFLASDASSYVTGQALVVDGGLSAW